MLYTPLISEAPLIVERVPDVDGALRRGGDVSVAVALDLRPGTVEPVLPVWCFILEDARRVDCWRRWVRHYCANVATRSALEVRPNHAGRIDRRTSDEHRVGRRQVLNRDGFDVRAVQDDAFLCFE